MLWEVLIAPEMLHAAVGDATHRARAENVTESVPSRLEFLGREPAAGRSAKHRGRHERTGGKRGLWTTRYRYATCGVRSAAREPWPWSDDLASGGPPLGPTTRETIRRQCRRHDLEPNNQPSWSEIAAPAEAADRPARYPALVVRVRQMLPARPGAKTTGSKEIVVRRTPNEGTPSFGSNH
jgi:hypothetical protein